MQEVFNKYINYLEAEKNASPYTVRNYTNDLLGFFDFLRTKKISSLKEVDRHTLRGYLSHLVEQDFAKPSIAHSLLLSLPAAGGGNFGEPGSHYIFTQAG